MKPTNEAAYQFESLAQACTGSHSYSCNVTNIERVTPSNANKQKTSHTIHLSNAPSTLHDGWKPWCPVSMHRAGPLWHLEFDSDLGRLLPKSSSVSYSKLCTVQPPNHTSVPKFKFLIIVYNFPALLGQACMNEITSFAASDLNHTLTIHTA